MDSNRVTSPDVIHIRKKRKRNDNNNDAIYTISDIGKINDNIVTDKELSQLCRDYGYNNYGNITNNINNNNTSSNNNINNTNM